MKAGEGAVDRRQYHHRLPGTINCVVPGDVVNVGSPGTREAGPRRRAASLADTVKGTDPRRRRSRGGMVARRALCVWHLLACWAFVNLELQIISHFSPKEFTLGFLPVAFAHWDQRHRTLLAHHPAEQLAPGLGISADGAAYNRRAGNCGRAG